MAYGIKYQSIWASESKSGTVKLYKLDYTGSTYDVDLGKDSLKINYNFGGWGKPIVKLNAQLTIINSFDDYFFLFDLLETKEKEWKLEIYNNTDSMMLFEGFVNADRTTHRYLTKQPINITASQYVGKLSNLSPEVLDDIKNASLSELIFSSLKSTDFDYPIYVNNSLMPDNQVSTTETFLSLAKMTTELFYKNNVEKDMSDKVMEKILTPFDTYFYWYDSKWYLERYNDLWSTGITYKVYPDLDTITGTTDVTETSTIYDFYVDFPHTQIPQFSIENGLSKIDVKLNLKKYLNMTNPDMVHWVEQTDPLIAVSPPYRGWMWHHYNIQNAIIYATSGYTYKSIEYVGYHKLMGDNGWDDSDTWGDNEEAKYHGIATKIKVSVPEFVTGETEDSFDLNIKFKWVPMNWVDDAYWKNENCEKYRVFYYVRNPANYYIHYNESTSTWERKQATAAQAYMDIEFNSDQVDRDTGMYTASVTIPLADTDNIEAGDQEFVVLIAFSQFYNGSWRWFMDDAIGDVTLSTSGGFQDNYMECEVAGSTFLEKKELSLDVFDSENYNVANGFVKYSNENVRIQGWNADGVNVYPLWQHLVGARMSLYKDNWYILSTTVKTDKNLKLFDKFIDSSDPHVSDKRYLLVAYTYTLEEDLYQLKLYEYSDEEINWT